MIENVLSLDNLSFAYREPLLQNVNMSIQKGDFVALLGNNGSGKSTLIRLILGELKPQRGKVTLFGKSDGSTLTRVGYVAQVNAAKIPSFPITASEMVALNLTRSMGFFKIPRKSHREEAAKSLQMVGMKTFSQTPFHTLSGGQQQRVMIAKALVHRPELLILDEPLVGIDEESRRRFLSVLEDLNRNHQLTILMVTHEFGGLQRLLSRKVKLSQGGIEEICL